MKIETHIPPAPDRASGMTETLLAMKPGNSIVVPRTKLPNWRSVARYNRLKVTAKKVSEDEARLWRVEA